MAAKQNSKRKKKRQGTPATDPAQSVRFLETAKNLDVDESGAAFEKALGAIIPRKKRS